MLRPEYEKIASIFIDEYRGSLSGFEAIRAAVVACQELADKPPKELTEKGINSLICHWNTSTQSTYDFVRAIESAAHAKQREPEGVKMKCYIYLNNDGNPFITTSKIMSSKLLDEFEREVTL